MEWVKWRTKWSKVGVGLGYGAKYFRCGVEGVVWSEDAVWRKVGGGVRAGCG